ncbi:hypothetical protein Q1695_006408 [Nippostrongylus brasiliensis]|nr:hypothetical protein Q1695_006408 [Nippostrongylus brasiliensis]
MSKIFGAACAAISSTHLSGDDRTTRLVDALVPSLAAFPIRLVFDLPNTSAETGWTAHRPVDVWIVDSLSILRLVIARVSYDFASRTLSVTLHSTVSCHRAIRRLVQQHGRLQDDAVRVSACIRLASLPAGTDPIFELLAEDEVFGTLTVHRECRANEIITALYDHRYARLHDRPASRRGSSTMTVRLNDATVELCDDQVEAVQIGEGAAPLVAIQAAYGTGKTVVGALIAARLAAADPNRLVVATATTNGAIAQFSESILRLTEYRHLHSLRFVTDTALMDGTPSTSVDLHNVLGRLATDYRDRLDLAEYNACRNYALGRRLVEEALFHPELTAQLSDEEREEYRIAERENPEATTEAFRIMFQTTANMQGFIIAAVLLLSLCGEHTAAFDKEKRKHEKEGWKFLKTANKFFKAFTIPASQPEAKSRCEDLGGLLAAIHSREENDFITNLAKENITKHKYVYDLNLWIGLEFTDRQWSWSDGSSVDYKNWAPGEPNRDDENCVIINQIPNMVYARWRFGQWSDYICNRKIRGFICEKHP